MEPSATLERRKYEQMWTFAEYRDDHASAHAHSALKLFGPPADATIIDFGAGAGYASRVFLDAGLRVTAIDIAVNSMAPDIAARVPLIIGNLWEMKVSAVADWGFCCDVMEHIPPACVGAVLRFIRASTKRATYFSVSLRPDGCGRLIGETLHLTVQPVEWWIETLRCEWSMVTVVAHEPGERADMIVFS